MDRKYYNILADKAIQKEDIGRHLALEILGSPDIELMPLLNAAYEVRRHFKGKQVTIHILNNTQNGYCPEDCGYCAQAKSSTSDIEEYPLKSDEEILAEAKAAYEKGAHRYCMVFAGRGPTNKRVEKLAGLVREIKSRYPIEVCISAGLLNDEKAQVLKDAGLDRLNHNLNTSEKNYPKICTTHTYQDRLNTLMSAKKAGIELCSGLIVGLQEELNDLLEVAYALRNIQAESIPVNFLLPIDGAKIVKGNDLSPEFCLKVLCVFRFLNPEAEIRVAAGREFHLRSMEVLSLYPANSLFLEGYLNVKGADNFRTLQMIKDAGFYIESEINLDELLTQGQNSAVNVKLDSSSKVILKDLKDLRPAHNEPSAKTCKTC